MKSIICEITLFAALTLGQALPEQVLPKFEVATIKPHLPGLQGVQVYPRARVAFRGLSLISLITAAYGVPYSSLSGGEDWMRTEEYDIEAQPSEAMQAQITDLRYTLFTVEDLRLRQMLQSLLIERFQLKVHRVTKTGDVYLLERSGKPLAMKPLDTPIGEEPSTRDSGAQSSIGYAGGRWGLFNTTMPQLAKFATDYVLHAPVEDRTSLEGPFTYRQASPDPDPVYGGDNSASFLNWLKEIGLKVEKTKAPIETLVIDSASKPSAN